MVESAYDANGSVRIVDIGGTRQYWGIFPENMFNEKNITITIVNLPGSDAPEPEPHFEYVAADGCSLDMFGDNQFHIGHANSVIEHVGDWERMTQFAHEISRIAERYYVQTPNYWFPIEPHFMTPFFHWLPKPMRVSLMMRCTLGQYDRKDSVDAAMKSVESARLLNWRMLQELFPDAMIFREHLFFLTKSIIAIY